MPTINLSQDDCTEWRADCNVAIQDLEAKIGHQSLLSRYRRFQIALELQETMGTLQPDTISSLLNKIRHGQFALSSLTPQDAALADRLAVCGLVETIRLGNAAIGFLGVTPRGTAVLEFLECWRTKHPWIVQM